MLRRPPVSGWHLLRARRRWSSGGGRGTLLAALVERSPQLTPDLPPHELEHMARCEALQGLQKVYPAALTAAEEGPDQQRARLRMEALVEKEGGRTGEGDRTGDERSLDSQLAQRLYLLVHADGQWQLPQQEWRPPETARDGLRRAIETSCGTDLAVHAMGNAPLGHMQLEGGEKLFLWRYLHVSGDVDAPEGVDYAWVTKDELAERVSVEGFGELATVVCGPYP
jgi:hypothetical protein